MSPETEELLRAVVTIGGVVTLIGGVIGFIYRWLRARWRNSVNRALEEANRETRVLTQEKMVLSMRNEHLEHRVRDAEREVANARSADVAVREERQQAVNERDRLAADLDRTRAVEVAMRTDLQDAGRTNGALLARLQSSQSEIQREMDHLSERLTETRESLRRANEALAHEASRHNETHRALQMERDARLELQQQGPAADPQRVTQLENEVKVLSEQLESARAGKDPVATLIGELEDARGDVWSRKPVRPPHKYSHRLQKSMPVMMIGNLKGGVGKTTLAANLAAHYHENDERVLLIDLDYQGSLSSMTTGVKRGRDQAATAVKALFDGRPVNPLPFRNNSRSGVIDCFYQFADQEVSLMLRWLSEGDRPDVRYILARYLQSVEVRQAYDRVIIDTAPRVSTAFINAFCAATHLIIPTRLDILSAETVESFLLKKRELMSLRCRGATEAQMRAEPTYLTYQVVGTMKVNDTANFSQFEIAAINAINAAVAKDGGDPSLLIRDAFIPTRAAFAKDAGFDVAYFNSPEVRLFIDRLAKKIEPFARYKWSEAA